MKEERNLGPFFVLRRWIHFVGCAPALGAYSSGQVLCWALSFGFQDTQGVLALETPDHEALPLSDHGQVPSPPWSSVSPFVKHWVD